MLDKFPSLLLKIAIVTPNNTTRSSCRKPRVSRKFNPSTFCNWSKNSYFVLGKVAFVFFFMLELQK
jgi:hypothetical protein